jgi:hypothetical protein
VLTHAPRQPRSWLIFNVRHKEEVFLKMHDDVQRRGASECEEKNAMQLPGAIGQHEIWRKAGQFALEELASCFPAGKKEER